MQEAVKLVDLALNGLMLFGCYLVLERFMFFIWAFYTGNRRSLYPDEVDQASRWERVIVEFSNISTQLGFLGTALGLILGLADIPKLGLEAASIALVTTAKGLVSGILVDILHRWVCEPLKEKLLLLGDEES